MLKQPRLIFKSVYGIHCSGLQNLWLCCVRVITLSLFPLLLAGCVSHIARNLSTSDSLPTPSARFEDVSTQAGIHFIATNGKTARKYFIETMGSGCALIDYNNDGLLDILLLNGTTLPGSPKLSKPSTMRLYRNNGDGTFTDVTHKMGLDKESFYAMGVAVGDYDDNGYDDFYVTCALGPGHLFHNEHGAYFQDVTRKAGVSDNGRWGTSAAWIQTTRHGHLDLFICNYVHYLSLKDDMPCYISPGVLASFLLSHDHSLQTKSHISPGVLTYCQPGAYKPSHCALYRNNGDGTFTDISKSSGIGNSPAKGLGVTVWDYDNDGLPDIFVSCDTVPSLLFHNLGHYHFQEVGLQSGIAVNEMGESHSGMGIDATEIGGKTTLVIANYAGAEVSLYREISPGLFTDDKSSSGVGAPSMDYVGFASQFFDANNSGHKDLLVINGHVQDNIRLENPAERYREPPLLYMTDGNGIFTSCGSACGPPFTVPIVGRGAACGDIFNDGKIDVVVTTNGGPAYLWRNITQNNNHWLDIHLIGTRCNRDGIGSRITVTANGSQQIDSCRSGSSYLSARDLRVHFGLGSAIIADVEIDWPDGLKENYSHIVLNRVWTVREGSGAPVK